MLLLALAVLVVACSSSEEPTENAVPPPSAAPSDPSNPADSSESPRVINLGVAAGRRPGQTPIDALIHVEQVTGRRVDTLRAYSSWDGEFPDVRHRWASDGGRMLHLSINARRNDGSLVPWHDIANASEGDVVYDELVAWVERLADYDSPLRVTFHHEADIEPEFGSPDEFVAAWRRFANLLDEAAPDVETVWVMTAFSLDKPIAELFWPGGEHVDVIGADAFNWFGCRGNPEAWRTPQEVIAPLMTFAANHPGKPLMLAELSSDEDDGDPRAKAAWLDELASLVAAPEYDRLETITFFHNDHDEDSTCDWWIDSTEMSGDAVRRLASLPLFGGDVAPSTTPQCPVIAMTASATTDVALVDGDGDGRFDFEFGGENRFIGVGDQSSDGADHRVLLSFDPVGTLPADATLELRLRIGERQPTLGAPVELRLLSGFDSMGEAFGQPGELLDDALFDASSLGGHHVFDMTGQLDPTRATALRLQLATPPAEGDGQSVLFLGTGDASRSIDRPTLIARLCE